MTSSVPANSFRSSVFCEQTNAATATAAAVQAGYERTAVALGAKYGERPQSLPAMQPIGREVSCQVADPSEWLTDTKGKLRASHSEPTTAQCAALIVGHDPGMSWLLWHLLRTGRGRIRRLPDVPSLDRAELVALRKDRSRWQPVWALTSGGIDDIDKVTAKIKSKMTRRRFSVVSSRRC